MRATIILFCLVSLTTTSYTQVRYLDKVIDDIGTIENIEYGINLTALYLPITGSMMEDSLLLDLYYPNNDTTSSRPLVLVMHDGNMLPPIYNNQIYGTKQDSSAVHICKELAHRGYVAASIDYRLGWDPLAVDQESRMTTYIQALYRSVQDGLTCIRFFKDQALNGNTYGIDTTKIAAIGLGSAGYTVNAMCSLTDLEDLLATEDPPNKFDILSGDTILQAINIDVMGDLESKIDGRIYIDLAGWVTTNLANHINYSSEFNLGINIGGGIGDIAWIDDGDTPIISIQSPGDMITPYTEDLIISNEDLVIKVQGSFNIAFKQDSLGNNQIFSLVDFDEDDATNLAKTNSLIAGHDYIEGLYPFIRESNTFGNDEGVALHWWDPYTEVTLIGQTSSIPLIELPHPLGGTFHEQGIKQNEGMSSEKAKLNINEVFSYILPRMCLALGLDDCVTNETSKIEDESNLQKLSIAPNPSSQYIMISTKEGIISNIIVTKINGQTVEQIQEVRSNQYHYNTSYLDDGRYIVTVSIDSGQTLSTLIIVSH